MRGIRRSKLRLYKKEMRSGPATQTAFAMRESRRCLPRSVPFPCWRCCQHLPVSGSKLRRCICARRRACIRSRGWLQSRHAEPFLRRPQRPVAHNAFTFREPQQFISCIAQADHPACRSRAFRSVHQASRSASDKLSRKLPQNQPCAITGSVTFTPAVNELSLISIVSTIGNRSAAVRNLWRKKLVCGRWRKKWMKYRSHVADRKQSIGMLLKGERLWLSTEGCRTNRIHFVAFSLLQAGSIRRVAEGHWRTS